MKILTLNYEYPPMGGGGGVHAANLARELVQRGHEVDYITTQYKGFPAQESIEGVRVFRESLPGRSHLHTASITSMLFYPPFAVKRGLALGRITKYDVVHTHFAVPTGPGGYLLSKMLRLPNVLTVYGGDIYDPSKHYSPHKHPILRPTVKRVLNQASVVVPESDDLVQRIAQYYNPRTPVHKIPLGLEKPKFSPATRAELGLSDDRIYAIAVARLISRKRFCDLLHAFAQANVPALNLLIIGDGPEENSLRDQARELGIADRVQFLGAIWGPKKFQYLHASDFFVLASSHEGFGIVYEEAMYCGLPVVTTNVGGQTDFLVHDQNALLVSPLDVASLAAAIRLMGTDENMRSKMKQANIRDIQLLMMSNTAADYVRLFESVIRH
ncbi:MAG: glycosyltransferase family 4 protein [Candidatus Sumerlaeaceae bacterium]